MILAGTLTEAMVEADAFGQKMRSLAAVINAAEKATTHTIRRVSSTLEWGLATDVRREVILSGVESRYYVRASMDPRVAARTLAHAVLTGTDQGTAWMPAWARVRVAVAVMRVEALEVTDVLSGPEVLAWHRLFGDTTVRVSRDAEGVATVEVSRG